MKINYLTHALHNIRDTLNKPADYGVVAKRDFSQTLPKVIHQIGINYGKLPEEVVKNVALIKSLNPGWTYQFYDEPAIQAYLKKHYPEVIALYNRISPVYGAAKADFFRYLLLYNEGGVYLDLKSTITEPLDQLLKPEDRYILSHWKNSAGEIHEGMGLHDSVRKHNARGEFQQWFIVSTKGHPFLKAVIENVCNNIKQYSPILHHVGGAGVISVTGPIAYTLAINEVKDQWPHRLVDSNEDIAFIYSIYEKQGLSFRHHKVFKKHYTESTEPIVQHSLLMDGLYRLVIGPILTLLRALKRSVFKKKEAKS